MGGGAWTRESFEKYSTSLGRSVMDNVVTTSCSVQEMFQSRSLPKTLDPRNVIRECCDSEEHPMTKPVILGIDVTGSMGPAAMEVAKKVSVVMTKLFGSITDVQFMIMGIGDLAYDYAPIQISQFESDIRIAEQLDQVYFEGGGGGNDFESYTAAWYMGSRHTSMDCLKRGQKGVIITMGDEPLNPYLPIQGRHVTFESITGDTPQDNIETKDLYAEASKKFDIYHLNVEHGYLYQGRSQEIARSFHEYLDEDHYRNVTLDTIADAIVDIVTKAYSGSSTVINESDGQNNMISWPV